MVRLMPVAVLAACLTACASVSESPEMRVSPASANGEQWLVSVKTGSGFMSDKVTLYVNGTAVADGSYQTVYFPEDSHGLHIVGDYEHHVVLCVYSESENGDQCVLSVDGEELGTLKF